MRTQEQVESLLVNISASHNWVNYQPDSKANFITFRTRYYQKQAYSDLKQELLTLIDNLNGGNLYKSTMNSNLTNGGESYKTFIKSLIELHRLLVRLEQTNSQVIVSQ